MTSTNINTTQSKIKTVVIILLLMLILLLYFLNILPKYWKYKNIS